MSLLSALTDLQSLAATVDGLVVYPLSATVTPPGVVFGLPQVSAETFSSGITLAVFDAYLVAALDDYAEETLLGYLDALVLALESTGQATVGAITPGVFTLDHGPELPAYSLSVTVPIDGG